jgi:hypothetical protein
MDVPCFLRDLSTMFQTSKEPKLSYAILICRKYEEVLVEITSIAKKMKTRCNWCLLAVHV